MISGQATPNNGEIDVQSVIPVNCTLKNLRISVNSNTRTTDTVFIIRNGGVSGNLTITVGAGLTGSFSDLVNTDVITAGDLLNYMITFGAGAGAISYTGAGVEITT